MGCLSRLAIHLAASSLRYIHLIHATLSYLTMPDILPDPFFRIIVANVNRNEHGSASITSSAEGRFRSQNFEDVFAKYYTNHKGGLTKGNIVTALGDKFLHSVFLGARRRL